MDQCCNCGKDQVNKRGRKSALEEQFEMEK